MATFSKRQQTLRPLLKENEDYLFSEIIVAEELVNAVRLLKGDYENVVVYYGHIKVVPEGDEHRLAFQYTIWDSATFAKEQLTGSQKFTTHLGDLLVSIISDEENRGEYYSPSKEDKDPII